MASDNPPFLPVGTEVSAKFKGAFCEAKIKKVNKVLRCKVNIGSSSSITVDSSQISGDIQLNGNVEVTQGRGHVKATIAHIKDFSVYTVVFDDGDEKHLKRAQIVPKGKPSFENGTNLNEMPLYNPERYVPDSSSPDLGKRKTKKVSKRSFESDSSDNDDNKMKPPLSLQRPLRKMKERPNSRLSVAPSSTRIRELQARNLRRCMSVSKVVRTSSFSDDGSDEEVIIPSYAKIRFRAPNTRQLSVPPSRLLRTLPPPPPPPKPEPFEESEEENEAIDGASTSGEQDVDHESEASSINGKAAKRIKKEESPSPVNSVISRVRRGTISSRSSSVVPDAYRPGTVVNIYEDANKKLKWIPAVVVAKASYDKFAPTRALELKSNEVPVKMFQTGKYAIKRTDELKFFEFMTKQAIDAIASNPMRSAVLKANTYSDNGSLPNDWTEEMIGVVDVDRPPLKTKTPSNYSSEQEDLEISSDDEKGDTRDLFVAKVYKFMEDRATPINRPPVLGGKDLDLYRFYKVVHKMGGSKRVTDRGQWKQVITHLKLDGKPGATGGNARVAFVRWLEKYEKFQKSLGWSSDVREETSKDDARSIRALDPKRQFLPLAKKSKEQQQAKEKESKEKEKEKNGVHHTNKEKEAKKEKEEAAAAKRMKKEKSVAPEKPQPSTSQTASESEKPEPAVPSRRGSVASVEKKEKKKEPEKTVVRKRHISEATVNSAESDEDEVKEKEKDKDREKGRKRKDSGPSSGGRGSSKRPQDGGPDNGTIGTPASVFSHFYIGQKVRALHNASYYDARVISIERPNVDEFFARLLACEICNSTASDTYELSEKGKEALREQLDTTKLLVHYLGWNARYDEWMNLDTIRVYSEDQKPGENQKDRLASTSDNAKKILEASIEYSLSVTQRTAQMKSAADSSNRLRRVSNASKKNMSPPLKNPKVPAEPSEKSEKSSTPEIVKKVVEEVKKEKSGLEATVEAEIEATVINLNAPEFTMPIKLKVVVEKPLTCKAVLTVPHHKVTKKVSLDVQQPSTSSASNSSGGGCGGGVNAKGSAGRARSTSTSSSKGSVISESGGGVASAQLSAAKDAAMVKQSMIKHRIEDKERHGMYKPQPVAKAHAKSESGSTDRKAGLFDIDFGSPQFTIRKKPIFQKRDKDAHHQSSTTQLTIVTSATAPVSNNKRPSVSALSSPTSLKKARLVEVNTSVTLEFHGKTETAHTDGTIPIQPRTVKIKKKFDEPLPPPPPPPSLEAPKKEPPEVATPKKEQEPIPPTVEFVKPEIKKEVKKTPKEENGYRSRLSVEVDTEPSTSTDVSPRVSARHATRHRLSNHTNHHDSPSSAASRSVINAIRSRESSRINSLSMDEVYEIVGMSKYELTDNVDENVTRLTQMMKDVKELQQITKHELSSAEKNLLRSKIS
ncbi:hypothetical protein QR680_011583 [Steinernema hermaphroditum]|uniref:ARID domain-containing protein n=1 Tax=Steinernema hermaphroditum TaxID=289476 RepID=A0AA39I191_9BILA|nr:hypothetical protein QR680_011583 [Steinernema hermaphroditum]